MKARVKATGEIVEVKEGTQIIFKNGSIGLGFRTNNGEILNDYQLDFKDVTQEESYVKEKSLPKDEPDYWEKLKYQYVGVIFAAMDNNHIYRGVPDEDLYTIAIYNAMNLVNKLKEEEK